MLLHGIARTRRSLERLRRALEGAGHATWACSYPSTRLDLASLTTYVAERIDRELGSGPVLAVTHSMGGILLRHLAAMRPVAGAVMLAPPNRGSAVARWLARNPLYRRLYGPAGQALGSDDGWPPAPSPCLVVAGSRSLSLSNPTSWLTRAASVFGGEPSDGTVAVSETWCEGVTEHVVVDANHTWIMNDGEVERLVLSFLELEALRGVRR